MAAWEASTGSILPQGPRSTSSTGPRVSTQVACHVGTIHMERSQRDPGKHPCLGAVEALLTCHTQTLHRPGTGRWLPPGIELLPLSQPADLAGPLPGPEALFGHCLPRLREGKGSVTHGGRWELLSQTQHPKTAERRDRPRTGTTQLREACQLQGSWAQKRASPGDCAAAMRRLLTVMPYCLQEW